MVITPLAYLNEAFPVRILNRRLQAFLGGAFLDDSNHIAFVVARWAVFAAVLVAFVRANQNCPRFQQWHPLQAQAVCDLASVVHHHNVLRTEVAHLIIIALERVRILFRGSVVYRHNKLIVTAMLL